MRAWATVLRVHAALVPMLDEELQANTGLPLAWYDVLLELSSADGRRLRMGDLGERVVLSRTRVSRLIDEMTTAGLVARQPNPADGRSSFASLTDEGRRRLRRAAPYYLDSIERHVGAAMAPGQTIAVIDGLGAVLERLEAADPPVT